MHKGLDTCCDFWIYAQFAHSYSDQIWIQSCTHVGLRKTRLYDNFQLDSNSYLGFSEFLKSSSHPSQAKIEHF